MRMTRSKASTVHLSQSAQEPAAMVRIIGGRRSPLEDVYASLLQSKWRWLFVLAACFYFAINAAFATAYWLIPDSLQGSKGGWLDAFFFSVQTFSTIGYGAISPQGLGANLLVTIEALVGIVCVAMTTGLIFAKFARPTARVLFSRCMVIHERDGVPCLVFRLANRRGSNIIEANLSMTVLLDERTKEGDVMKRLHDMTLQRSTSPLFLLSWTVIHPINQESPLYGMSFEEMKSSDMRIFLSLTGIDGVLAQTVHAYFLYVASDILWNRRFVDVIERLPDGRTQLDLRPFHDTLPCDGPLRIGNPSL